MARTWKATRGLGFDSVRLRHNDRCLPWSGGQVQESRYSAGLRPPHGIEPPFLTQRGHVVTLGTRSRAAAGDGVPGWRGGREQFPVRDGSERMVALGDADHAEATGIFELSDLVDAFGAKRQQAPDRGGLMSPGNRPCSAPSLAMRHLRPCQGASSSTTAGDRLYAYSSAPIRSSKSMG